jgi:predicted metal-dependent phosphotriesterase family hydrolase
MEALKVFISHSNKDEDNELVRKEVIPKLEAKNIRICGQECFVPGNQVIPTITNMVDNTDKTLLFMSKNAMESLWCSFELLISLEKAQRTNRLSVVLLLHGISASEVI